MKKAASKRKEAIRELAEGIKVLEGFNAKDYLSPASTPVVSIYIPVKKTQRDDRQQDWDRIDFKDLAKEAKRRLSESYDKDTIRPILKKLEYILENEDLPLWINASAGLAFLVSAEEADVYNMCEAPASSVTVGDNYYLKPLIEDTKNEMYYKLLLLNSDFFSVLDGNYNGVSFEQFPDSVKHYFAETFPEFDGETTALDYYSLEDHEPPYHDHKSRNEVTQEETEKFFRYVNKEMNDTIVRDSETPVILVTLPEHENMFRKICSFKSLAPQSILKDARTLTGAELRDDAVKIIQDDEDVQIKDLIEKYEYHLSKGSASNSIPDIGLALVERKVAVLFLADGKGLPGTFDGKTGQVDYDPSTNPVDDKELDPASPDIANAFAEACIAQDGEVIVLDADKMPGGAFIAATYRY